MQPSLARCLRSSLRAGGRWHYFLLQHSFSPAHPHTYAFCTCLDLADGAAPHSPPTLSPPPTPIPFTCLADIPGLFMGRLARFHANIAWFCFALGWVVYAPTFYNERHLHQRFSSPSNSYGPDARVYTATRSRRFRTGEGTLYKREEQTHLTTAAAATRALHARTGPARAHARHARRTALLPTTVEHVAGGRAAPLWRDIPSQACPDHAQPQPVPLPCYYRPAKSSTCPSSNSYAGKILFTQVTLLWDDDR